MPAMKPKLGKVNVSAGKTGFWMCTWGDPCGPARLKANIGDPGMRKGNVMGIKAGTPVRVTALGKKAPK